MQSTRYANVRFCFLCTAAGLAAIAPSATGERFRITRFSRRIVVTNPSDTARNNAIVAFSCQGLTSVVRDLAGVEVSDGQLSLPAQLDDLDGDGVADEVVFQLDLGPKETKTLWLTSLKADERALAPAKRVHAEKQVVHPGYAALESTLAAYGIHCMCPTSGLCGTLQLQCYGKPAGSRLLELTPQRRGPAGPETSAAPVALLRIGDSFGLGGPTIGGTRPRHNETAVVARRVLCAGPLRAGIEVAVRGWRTAGGGVYDARFQYFMYADREFVDLRVRVQARKAAAEHLGIGLAAFGQSQDVYGDAAVGYLGQWGIPSKNVGPVGLALVLMPKDVAVAEGFDDAPGRLPGNRVAYLAPRLDAAASCTWRLFLVADWQKGGRVDRGTFPRRLSELAKELAHPILVDDRVRPSAPQPPGRGLPGPSSVKK